MIDEYTECVIDLGSGEVHFWDPFQIRGRGMPGAKQHYGNLWNYCGD